MSVRVLQRAALSIACLAIVLLGGCKSVSGSFGNAGCYQTYVNKDVAAGHVSGGARTSIRNGGQACADTSTGLSGLAVDLEVIYASDGQWYVCASGTSNSNNVHSVSVDASCSVDDHAYASRSFHTNWMDQGDRYYTAVE